MSPAGVCLVCISCLLAATANTHVLMADRSVLREAQTLFKPHSGGPQPPSGPKELFFQQTLNHFNYLDNRTWLQRYFLQGASCMS